MLTNIVGNLNFQKVKYHIQRNKLQWFKPYFFREVNDADDVKLNFITVNI